MEKPNKSNKQVNWQIPQLAGFAFHSNCLSNNEIRFKLYKAWCWPPIKISWQKQRANCAVHKQSQQPSRVAEINILIILQCIKFIIIAMQIAI